VLENDPDERGHKIKWGSPQQFDVMNAFAIFTAALILASTLSIAAGNEDTAYEKLLAVCARAIEVWRVTRGKLHREATMEPDFSGCSIKEVLGHSEVAVRLTGQRGAGSAARRSCRISLRYPNRHWVKA
jgi:hypothetical protein